MLFFTQLISEIYSYGYYRHTSFYCTSLYCALQILHFFLQIQSCCNLVSSKSVGAISPTAFSHFMSLCHMLVILTMFQTFSSFDVFWWPAVSGLWCYYCNCSGVLQTVPPEDDTQSVNVVYVLTAPLTSHSSFSVLLLGSSYSLKYNNFEIEPISSPTMASTCSSERKS